VFTAGGKYCGCTVVVAVGLCSLQQKNVVVALGVVAPIMLFSCGGVVVAPFFKGGCGCVLAGCGREGTSLAPFVLRWKLWWWLCPPPIF